MVWVILIWIFSSYSKIYPSLHKFSAKFPSPSFPSIPLLFKRSLDPSSMSTVSAKTAIPEDPNGVESLTAAEGQNERESALPVDNNTSNAVELGTLDCPEAGTGANTVNEAKDDGDVATRASLVEGLLMNGSVIGNAEIAAAEQKPLLSPKTLENADTLFQEVCDALKAGDFVDAVDFPNLCTGNQLPVMISNWGSYR